MIDFTNGFCRLMAGRLMLILTLMMLMLILTLMITLAVAPM